MESGQQHGKIVLEPDGAAVASSTLGSPDPIRATMAGVLPESRAVLAGDTP